MQRLGKKSEVIGSLTLRPLEIKGKPTEMPPLHEGEKVICGYDQGLDEDLIICDSLQEMQQCYDGYCNGWAIRIAWYAGDDPGFLWVETS